MSGGTRKTKNALAEVGVTIGKTDIDPGNGALHVEPEGLLADLRTELSAETSRRRELESKLLARTREIAQLKRSSSWLITAPMRKLGQGLRRFLAMTGGLTSDDKQLIREGASKIVCSSGRHAGERDESSSQCDSKVSTTPSGVKRTQYQSLEGLAGGSDSSGKLSRLKLDQLGRGGARPLEGFSVLDLGCNEGFFCNAARELGAARVVGIDRSEDFIQRARLRFPEIKFLHGSWWDLPDEQFDVILFLSAIHYEPEQKKLLDLLSTRLKPEGTLVLECGAVADDHRAPSWQAIERHDGLKRYPTFAHLRRGLLSKFAVRVIGQSVPQRGDPIPRVVLHCTPRRPVALLIHGDSMSGKSTLAELLRMGNVPSYSIDRLFFRLAFDEAYSRSDLSKWLRKVCGDQKNWSIAAKAIVDQTRQQDFAARIIAELPISEAPVFAIEGEALCHESILTAVNEALEARGVIVWSMGRLSHT